MKPNMEPHWSSHRYSPGAAKKQALDAEDSKPTGVRLTAFHFAQLRVCYHWLGGQGMQEATALEVCIPRTSHKISGLEA